MTRHELVVARTQVLQWLEPRILGALVVAAALCFPTLVVFARQGSEFAPSLRVAGLALPLLIAVGVPVFFRFRAQSKARALGLTCPHCGASLLRDPLRAGVCSTCHAPVFPEESNVALPSALELFDRISTYEDAVERWEGISFAVWGGAVGGGLLVGLVYRLKKIPEPSWAGWFGAVFLLIAITGPLLYGALRTNKLVDVLGLHCPNCDEPLVGGTADEITKLTIRTQHCPSCGASVMQESDAPTAD